MGGEKEEGVIEKVKREGIERKGGKWQEEEEEELKRKKIEMLERKRKKIYEQERIWDEGIVDKRKRREVIGMQI